MVTFLGLTGTSYQNWSPLPQLQTELWTKNGRQIAQNGSKMKKFDLCLYL